MSYNKNTKPFQPKPKKIPFSELVEGYLFALIGVAKLPEGTHYWCAFCGGRLENYLLLKRSDGKEVKVGSTCLHRVGIDIPDEFKKLKKLNANKEEPAPKESNGNELDDEILEMLKSL